MHLIKNCLIQKVLYDFKEGKIWRVNFLCVLRGFEISKVIFIFLIGSNISFFAINRENIKFQVKRYSATLVLNLRVKEIFYDNLYIFGIF